MRQILDRQGRCMDYLFDYQRLVLRLNEERDFAMAFECYICHHPFNKEKGRDNDHLTGKYRGAAHEGCNLMLRKTYKVPVFFDNFRGYDWHDRLGLRSFPQLDINLIAEGMQIYLTLGWG